LACMRATPAKPSSTTQSILTPGRLRAASLTAGHWCTTSPREDVLTKRSRLPRVVRVEKGLVGRAQAFGQGDARLPAQRAREPDIEQLLRRAVGLGAVVHDLGPAADRVAHAPRQLGDGQVFAAAHVDQRRSLDAEALAHVGGILQEMDAGLGHVVAVEELAP